MTLQKAVPVAEVRPTGRVKAFVTLFKLRIFTLLWAESVVGLLLASGLSFDLYRLAALSAAGFLATAGSGALNNYFDRDIDAKMKRTSSRPIPSKRVTPREALTVGIAMGALGISVALFGLSPLSGVMVASGYLTYAVVYTYLLKRRTSWNIVVGGAAGSFAFLAGWAAAAPVGLEASLIALIVFLWTPSHFWALAIKAVRQYENAGIPMLPVVAGVRATAQAIVANSVALVACSLLPFALGYFGYLYLAFAAVLGFLLLYSDVRLMTTGTPSAAWSAYKFTAPYLLVLSLAMVADRLIFHAVALL
ncbi:MAG TPA: heme o synthase [Conexivisphaerales archaeon]|nr:heme o synthase [Conexivisphaerales archaeon]